jgi:hypothetical protein
MARQKQTRKCFIWHFLATLAPQGQQEFDMRRRVGIGANFTAAFPAPAIVPPDFDERSVECACHRGNSPPRPMLEENLSRFPTTERGLAISQIFTA